MERRKKHRNKIKNQQRPTKRRCQCNFTNIKRFLAQKNTQQEAKRKIAKEISLPLLEERKIKLEKINFIKRRNT